MTGRRTPTSSIMTWTSSMSETLRTKDRAIMSASARVRAQRRSSRSLSLRAGTDTATPGRLRPL